MTYRAIAMALSLGLSLPAHAAYAPAEGGEGVDPRYEEAKQLYEKGRGLFETADYAGAVETWTEAYNMLPPTRDSARIKALLLYDIAGARELAYEVDNEISHLRQAKILLEQFEANIPSLYGEGKDADEEYTRVRERMAKIQEQIDAAGEPDDAGEPKEDPTTSGPVDDGPGDRGGKGMLVAGGVLLGLGVAGLGVMAGGLAMGSAANDLGDLDDGDITGRRDQFDRGRTGNVMAYVGGIAGGVMAVTGAVLVGIGAKRRASKTAWAPVATPTFAGVAVTSRF